MSPAVVDAVVALAALPVLGCGVYLALLTALSWWRPPVAETSGPETRFELVVPAHDEEAGIGRTVASLGTLDYPRALFQVTVVADNCADQTAKRAGEMGARVLVRDDPERRGKGYALSLAFDRVLAEGFADAVVVIDADAVVSPGLLRAYAARLERGAAAVQGDNAVLNWNDSWRTRLMSIALGAFHRLRSIARERLGLSCGLRGNGMCLSCRVLREVPHQAYSMAEDLEYGLLLAEAGHRVHYAGDGHIYSEMVTREGAARSQRRRWEEGRRQLAWRHAPRLLAGAVARTDRVLLDVALDLLVPPVGNLTAAAIAGLTLAATLSLVWSPMTVSVVLWAATLPCVLAYLLRGWWLSGTGLAGLLDLAVRGPLYVLWKVALRLRPREHAPTSWVRTQRERTRPL